MAFEQTGLGQYPQVLGQSRLGDPDERREFLGTSRPLGDQPQSTQSGVVRQCAQDPGQLRRRDPGARLAHD